jgi:hypothetical protein
MLNVTGTPATAIGIADLKRKPRLASRTLPGCRPAIEQEGISLQTVAVRELATCILWHVLPQPRHCHKEVGHYIEGRPLLAVADLGPHPTLLPPHLASAFTFLHRNA